MIGGVKEKMKVKRDAKARLWVSQVLPMDKKIYFGAKIE